MAQLDPLLRALIDRHAEELILIDGQKPALRHGEQTQPVYQTALNRAQILTLIAELSDQLDASRPVPGGSATFVYRAGDGQSFHCKVDDDGQRFQARLAPRPDEPEPEIQATAPASIEAMPPAAAAAPAPAANPVPTAAPAPAATPAPAANAKPGADEPSPSASGTAREIDALLRQMVELGASDLHLSAGEVPRVRVHGEMAELPEAPRMSSERTLQILESIMPERNRKDYRESNDTDFAYEIEGLARFRANVFTDRKGTGGVLRVIPTKIMTAEELGLPQALLELCKIPKGLVLVTGPTGSGKSTTLATMVDHVNRTRTDHIITIEDPIEFVHDNHKCLVNQREVHAHTDGFKPALRAALREDPDIVLVGELRDLETIAIAIETAETGHLVFGTLHTSTACSTVDRLIDQFSADRQAQIRTMLSESLRGVVSQMLLKKISGGRVAAMEILIVTPAISNLIRESKTFQIPSLMQTGKRQGMMLLNDALLTLVKKKIVTPDEALSKAVDKAGFTSQLKAGGFRVSAEKPAGGGPGA